MVPTFPDAPDAEQLALLERMATIGADHPPAAVRAWRDGRVPLNAAEGFVRQILGWREFVRGVYWTSMPAYARSNALAADRPLPSFYWTGETRMHCLKQAIDDTRRYAYSHHIQRLMITGNFALLAGVAPHEIERWYLAVYADAFEWVEMPNTLGMATFADGGRLASKPYAASGAYIDRMSDYCKGCRYDRTKRTGDYACPFTTLYWDFLARHEQRFARNARIVQQVRAAQRLSDLDAVRVRAAEVLDRLDAGTL